MPIRAIAHAIPRIRHTASDLAAATGADEGFIREKIGVDQRFVLDTDETGVSLSRDACEALFAREPDLRTSVELLVCVTQTPDRRLPQNSALLADALGIPHQVASFDISLGCSGYVYALSIVEGFLATTGRDSALLVTCDPYSRIIDPSDKATNCVFGDAATVTWISRTGNGGGILSTDFGTDGSKGDAIQVPGGGASLPINSLLEPELLAPGVDLRLHMNGRAVFNFVNSVVPRSILVCLEKAELALPSIDWFALHQGSKYMLEAMAKRVGIPSEKLLNNMDRFGNTVSSSVPLLLADLQDRGALQGKTVLVSGFGVGLSWATAVLRF